LETKFGGLPLKGAGVQIKGQVSDRLHHKKSTVDLSLKLAELAKDLSRDAIKIGMTYPLTPRRPSAFWPFPVRRARKQIPSNKK